MAESPKPKKPKTTGKNNRATDDAAFESFLQRQFAALRIELDQHIAGQKPKSGKQLEFPSATRRRPLAPWKYGIAALALVAVSVPMILQLNKQKAELVQNSAAPAQAEKSRVADKMADADAMRPAEKEENDAKTQGYFNHKKTARTDGIVDKRTKERASDEEEKASPTKDLFAMAKNDRDIKREEKPATEAIVTGRAAPGADKSELAGSVAEEISTRRAEAAPASPAAPPASAAPAPAPAKPPVMAAKRRAPMAGDEPPESGANEQKDLAQAAKSRSIAVDDVNAKLKKQAAKEDQEKEEMEKLWKEFEKNPDTFSRDKKRSARLKVLLSRHNEKSRAKRVKSAEVEAAR